MKAENFCFWLQGYFEVSGSDALSPKQVEQIKTHLALVFKHDPAMAHDRPKDSVAIQDQAQRLPSARPRGFHDGVLYC